ncbi:MAG TPA: glycoside hydrolase family 2 TIM barrel-domain containing protein [Clostridia bacterium]|nr:glycoside hydrolase family 2 TIM barrel-domain containing protein [Clostridia bacterium]
MKTRWYDEACSGSSLSEYPRPQFVRDEWECLNGEYEYAVTALTSTCPKHFEGKIRVPFAIESRLSGVKKKLKPNKILWYKRSFEVNKDWLEKRVLLNFGAVDWHCWVFVNGTRVGHHSGGYCPFSIDITDFVNETDNTLVVKVYDPTDSGWQQRGKQVLKPHGIWYTSATGIWQTVWLEVVDECRIEEIKLTPNIDDSILKIKADLSRNKGTRLVANVYENEKLIFSGDIKNEDCIEISNPILWSPENPFLYDIHFELYCGNELRDKVKSYFGMRKFSVGKDKSGLPRLMLNNKPYFQCGILDQGYWSDGVMTPPTDEAMVYDIQTMKNLGFNMIRKHIKVEPLRWYYHCDRIGMIVWQDMISGGEYIGNLLAGILPNLGITIKDSAYNMFKRSERTWRDFFEKELFEMIDTLYNCPSIACWVPFNEGWGQFDSIRIADAVKAYDPDRLVDHASGWYDRGGGDLKSVHRYILPVRKPKKDERPFVLSEFGGYSRIVNAHVWNKRKSFGYKMYKDKRSLTKSYKKLMEKQIIPLIEKGLSATVYTQLSDVEFEVNGFLTYDREVLKIDEDVIKELNDRILSMI